MYCKLIGEMKGVFYVFRGFFDEWGRLKNFEDFKNYFFIGFDWNEEVFFYFWEMGFEIGFENFCISVNCGFVIMVYVCEGLGIMLLIYDFVSLYLELEMVLLD